MDQFDLDVLKEIPLLTDLVMGFFPFLLCNLSAMPGANFLVMGSSSDSTSSRSMRSPGAGSGALGAGVSSVA